MEQAACVRRDIESALRTCVLLDSVRAMYAARNAAGLRQTLEKHILALIREVIPAEHGAVLLEDGWGDTSRVDKDIVMRVLAERSALSGNSENRSRLAAPLLVGNEIAGVIYLESPETDPELQEPQLLLLSAIAQMASLALENAYHVEWLHSEVRRLERKLDDDEMAGESEKLKSLRRKIARLAPTNTTILIVGESGTGKELVARSLHRQSARAEKPFVAINCAALTESLLESELFGHEKGAFTGAIAQKQGRLERGQGGTVFLDEIGEMPVALQSKLLRVLQSREFERVGGTRSIALDIRLIAATNRNLEEAVQRGLFREDLFYRLNVVTLRMPALRERPEDILCLALHFAARMSEKCGRRIAGISPQARSMLRNHDWPGNVRELENAIEHAVALGASDTILAEDLPETLREKWAEASPDEAGMLQSVVNSAKRAAVTRAYEISKRDHNKAARMLGVHPNYLYRLIHNLNLQALVKTMARE
jgi:two-component system, NtrC family, response regulator HydG